MTETRRRAFGLGQARPGRGLFTATIAILWIVAIAPSAWGETTRWKVGKDGLSWSSQSLASSATDFSVPGAMQIVSFGSEDNIIQQLAWVEEYPLDFVVERAQARIWDNQPLPLPNTPIVDGIDSTSTGTRFKKAGQNQSGVTFFFDLGARFPANRVVFFPRQIGEDADGFAYREDYLRSYRIQVSDGLTYDANELPVYTLLKEVQFTRDSVQEFLFPLQMLRYLRLTVTSPSPFEIAEFQLFGGGFAPQGKYLSDVIDLGEAANFNRIEWVTEYLGQEGDSLAVVPDADAGISFQMRTGTDDSPQVHYKYVNLRGKGGHRIQYRHIIDWLVRKPGAFSHYRYRDDLFPTTRFRMAYDVLCAQHSASTASRQYLRILHLAARESETQVEVILARLLGTDETLSADCVEALLQTAPDADSASVAAAVVVGPVDLRLYDDLLSSHQPAAEVVV